VNSGRNRRDRRIDRFWASPLWSVVGVVISVIRAIVFYVLGNAKKEPVYAVGTTEVLARTEKLASRLSILWDQTPYENVCITNIALWNSGKQFIDGSDFISPVNVVASRPIPFLYAEQRRSSRPELSMKVPERAPGSSNLTQNIAFTPPVGEAFEKDDGVLLKIVFSGSSDTKFSVQSRIKGAPQGFKEIDLQSLQPSNKWIGGIFGMLFAVAAVAIVVGLPRQIRAQGMGWWFLKESLGLLGVLGIALLLLSRVGEPVAPAWVGVKAVRQSSSW
jgi:hypothetical protein